MSNHHSVILAIGTNVGDKISQIAQALEQLADFCSIIQLSDVYVSKAMYVTDQADFYNLVARVETVQSPQQLLQICKQIEQAVGRQHRFRYGPREIDIDIILYDQLIYQTDTLQIPHALMCERDFVMVPLNSIAPDYIHPQSGQSISQLLGLLPATTLPVVLTAAELVGTLQIAGVSVAIGGQPSAVVAD